MSQSNIHPTAIIESGAKIGKNVTIEAYAIIKKMLRLKIMLLLSLMLILMVIPQLEKEQLYGHLQVLAQKLKT